jgi:phosphonate transport system substrate-binding protein
MVFVLRKIKKYYFDQKYRPYRLALLLLTITFGLIACDSSESIPVQTVDQSGVIQNDDLLTLNVNKQEQGKTLKATDKTIYFGFDLRSSPQEDAAQYIPFLEYLTETTDYHFKLHFTPKNSSSAQELGSKKIQLAAMGAVSYLKAKEKFHAKALVLGLNKFNKAEYQSYFIAQPESRIKNIRDIYGKRMAFGSVDSTQGHLIPRIVMKKNGISLDDLSSYQYTGSHQNCAEAVVSGKVDVCALQDEMARSLSESGLAKIIHISDYYPSSGIVASKELGIEKIETIKKALTEFEPNGKHENILYNWKKTEMPNGFTHVKESDYEELREWLIQMNLM